MLICLCKAVNDQKVRATIRSGASTVREVGRACGAGTDCGACHRMIRCMIDGDEKSETQRAPAKAL
jgi:bacterioferritin-associated ferredoxin